MSLPLHQPLDFLVQGEGHPAHGLLHGVHHLALLPGDGPAYRVHPVSDRDLPLILAQHVVHSQLDARGPSARAVQVANQMGRQLVLPVALGHLEYINAGVFHRLFQDQLKGPAVFQGQGQLVPVLAAGGLFQGADGLNCGGHCRHILGLSPH